MTTEEIRNTRKSFAAQLTNMIRDFEGQTGVTIQGINVERMSLKECVSPRPLSKFKLVSIFKGVYVSLSNPLND